MLELGSSRSRAEAGLVCEPGGTCERLDPRVWKAIVMRSLARTVEGLAVCDKQGAVLFATPLAVHLLGRLGISARGPLSESLVNLVDEHLHSPDRSRTGRLPSVRGGSAVLVHAAEVQGLVMLFVREEILRDDGLYERLKAAFTITPRGFQLAQLVRKGLSNKEISDQLHLAQSTVKVYLHRLYRDCGVSSRTSLVALLERSARG